MNTTRLLLGGALFAALSAVGQMPSVPGEPALGPKAAAEQPQLRLSPESAPRVVLSPVTDSELAGVRSARSAERAVWYAARSRGRSIGMEVI